MQPIDARSATPEAFSATRRGRLALLEELYASLRETQEALLQRDVSMLEQQSTRQIFLQQQLSHLTATPLGDEASSPSEVLQAHARVLQLGRIQLALLRRASQSLQITSNLVQGLHSGYGPAGAVAAIATPRALSPSMEA